MKRQTKVILYLAGTTLLLLSLVYVALRIAENWASVRDTRIESTPWLLACIGIYAVSHVSTGLSWPLAVRQLGTHISIRDGLRIGLVAQIGKYLPGNVAHYIGRGAMAANVGISFRSTGMSTAIELASAVSAALIVAITGLLIDPRPIEWLPDISASTAPVVIAVLAGLAATSIWLARRGMCPALLAGPTLCLAASLTLSGLSVYALASALGHLGLPIAAAVSSFALAWVIGFVVPGAPAGLGVREVTLLALLGPVLGPGPAITTTIFHRLVTAAVDAGAALIGYAWLASGTRSKK